MDENYVKKLEKVQPLVRERALLFVRKLEENGYRPIITQGYRSIREQNDLYAQGRSKPGKVVTNAQGGESFHCWGLAIDLGFLDTQGKLTYEVDWDDIAKVGKSLGFEWGDRGYVDKPHFQLIGGLNLRALLLSKNPQNMIEEALDRVPRLEEVKVPHISNWASEAVNRAKKKGIKDWENPQQVVDAELLYHILSKLELVEEKDKPEITKEQLIVVIDRLKPIL